MSKDVLWDDERIRASAYNVATTMPNGLKMVSLHAMRGQMERMRDTYEAERAAAAGREQELRAQLNEAIEALKMAYRKHHLEDESMGWDELSHTLLNTLSNTMGVEELLKWQNNEIERVTNDE